MPTTRLSQNYTHFKHIISDIVRKRATDMDNYLAGIGLKDSGGTTITTEALYISFQSYKTTSGEFYTEAFKTIPKSAGAGPHTKLSDRIKSAISKFINQKISIGEYSSSSAFDPTTNEAECIANTFAGLHCINYIHQEETHTVVSIANEFSTPLAKDAIFSEISASDKTTREAANALSKIAGSEMDHPTLVNVMGSTTEANEITEGYVTETLRSNSTADSELAEQLEDTTKAEEDSINGRLKNLAKNEPQSIYGVVRMVEHAAPKKVTEQNIYQDLSLVQAAYEANQALSEDEREALYDNVEEAITNGTEIDFTNYDSVKDAIETTFDEDGKPKEKEEEGKEKEGEEK